MKKSIKSSKIHNKQTPMNNKSRILSSKIFLIILIVILLINPVIIVNGIIIDDWQVISGNWIIQEDRITGTPDPFNRRAIVLSKIEPDSIDYDLIAKVRMTRPINQSYPRPEGHFIVKYVDSDNYYFVGLGVFGYRAGICKYVNDQITFLAWGGNSNYSDIEFNVEYDLKVEVRGYSINVYVDEQFVCSTIDDSHTTGLAGLSSIYSETMFYNLDGAFIRPLEAEISPTANTVIVGESASFTVSSSGEAPYSYQWYESDSIMSGKTSAQITITKSTIGSFSYYCRVIDVMDHTIDSNVVFLNVNELPLEFFDLDISVSGLGSTSPGVGSNSYEEDSEVVVTAYPNSNWSFSHWLVNSVNMGSNNPYTVKMDRNHAITAVFLEIVDEDDTPPTGSIVINGGITKTNSETVTLSLTALDLESGVTKMRFSHDGITWTEWEAYSTTKVWTLTHDDGIKSVYVQFQNGVNLESITYSSTIQLETENGGTDTNGQTNEIPLWIIFLVVIVILLVIIIYYFLKIKKTKPKHFWCGLFI